MAELNDRLEDKTYDVTVKWLDILKEVITQLPEEDRADAVKTISNELIITKNPTIQAFVRGRFGEGKFKCNFGSNGYDARFITKKGKVYTFELKLVICHETTNETNVGYHNKYYKYKEAKFREKNLSLKADFALVVYRDCDYNFIQAFLVDKQTMDKLMKEKVQNSKALSEKYRKNADAFMGSNPLTFNANDFEKVGIETKLYSNTSKKAIRDAAYTKALETMLFEEKRYKNGSIGKITNTKTGETFKSKKLAGESLINID